MVLDRIQEDLDFLKRMHRTGTDGERKSKGKRLTQVQAIKMVLCVLKQQL